MEERLTELVEILNNTNDAVVFKVKDNKQIELLSIGCFNGDEKFISVAKLNEYNENNIYTIVYNDNRHFSFTSNELVGSKLRSMKMHLERMIIFDFGIPIFEKHGGANYIQSIEDDLKADHVFSIEGFGEEHMNLRKDYAFMIGQLPYNVLYDYINNRYKIIEVKKSKSLRTSCDIITIKTKGEK